LPALVGALACSDPDQSAEGPAHARAHLTFTLSEAADEHTCQSAAPNPYRVGSEDAPLTDGKDVVGCSIHEDEKNSWFSGNLQGGAEGGFNVVFSMSTESGLAIALASDLTGTLLLDRAAADCAPPFTVTIGSAVSAEFDCPLLADPTYPTSGCGLRGSVNFENCDSP
jgi:hypothetical protein